MANGGPVGGTSAGLAVLTQFVYSALGSQGVTSTQALADPYNKYVTLARDFIAVRGLEGTIGETHFVPRDRMGRTLAFLCRIHEYGWSIAPRAIAVDEETALLINERGVATVVGKNAAYSSLRRARRRSANRARRSRTVTSPYGASAREARSAWPTGALRLGPPMP